MIAATTSTTLLHHHVDGLQRTSGASTSDKLLKETLQGMTTGISISASRVIQGHVQETNIAREIGGVGPSNLGLLKSGLVEQVPQVDAAGADATNGPKTSSSGRQLWLLGVHLGLLWLGLGFVGGNLGKELALQVTELGPAGLDFFVGEAVTARAPGINLLAIVVASHKLLGDPHGMAVEHLGEKRTEAGAFCQGHHARLELVNQAVDIFFFLQL